MCSFVAVLCWSGLYLLTLGQTKQTIIDSNSAVNGITMLYNNASVITDSNEWKVTFVSQQGYDLLLQLNNEWGWDTSYPSSIILILNGTNYNTGEGDLLLVFSVSNQQYFGIVIRNEVSSQLYKAYPEPLVSPLIELNVASMISPEYPDRWDRITEHTFWYNTVPIYRNVNGKSPEWPIKISIMNDPIKNYVEYSQLDFNTDRVLYSARYLSSFGTNNGMDIYFMSDGEAESFGIYDINIQYEIQIAGTYNPTLTPSTFPSISPTSSTPGPISVSPTNTPSKSPTTQYPTTNLPTHVVSILSPTISPTINLPKITTTSTSTSTSTATKSSTSTSRSASTSSSTSTSTSSSIATSLPISLTISEEKDIETTIDDDTKNIVTVPRNDIISYNQIDSNHDDVIIASVITGIIGGILCIFTMILIFFCIQSQGFKNNKGDIKRKESESTTYKLPKSLEMAVAIPSNTYNNHCDNINHLNDTLIAAETSDDTDDNNVAETDDPETDDVNDSRDDEKEGELITTDIIGMDHISMIPRKPSDNQRYHDPQNITMVVHHSLNLIDYNKLNEYIQNNEENNEDDDDDDNVMMSSSSGENILEQQWTQTIGDH